MTVHPSFTVDPATYVRPSVRVAVVAEMLDTHESEVRRLIDRGELEAHTVGKRGVRVFLDSVGAYQDRQRRPVKSAQIGNPGSPQPRASASAASFRAAMAGLRAKGLG